jgi:hypothetical protein
MYSELAGWWPLVSPPSHYVEEAADLLPDLINATEPPPRTMLELGSGGGSLAFHFKNHCSPSAGPSTRSANTSSAT